MLNPLTIFFFKFLCLKIKNNKNKYFLYYINIYIYNL